MTKAEQTRVTAWRLKVLRWSQGEPRQVARTCRDGLLDRAALAIGLSLRADSMPANTTAHETASV
jgi:hypothetical protein